MTTYMRTYSADDLFDMFANDADMVKLAKQPEVEIAQQLSDLAPDMEDTEKVAQLLRSRARTIALNHRFGANREQPAW